MKKWGTPLDLPIVWVHHQTILKSTSVYALYSVCSTMSFALNFFPFVPSSVERDMENSNSVTWALSHCVTDDFLSFTNRNSLFFDFVTRNRKEIKKDAANIESLLFNSSRFESSFPRHFERQLFCRIVRDNLEVYQSRRADHGLINLQSVCLASYFRLASSSSLPVN